MHLTRNETEKCVMARIVRQKKLHQKNFTLKQHGTWPKTNSTWWRKKIEANRSRDQDTDSKLRAAGWIVLRFWEHMDPVRAARQVSNALRE